MKLLVHCRCGVQSLIIIGALFSAGCQHLQLLDANSTRRLPKSSVDNPVKEIIGLWEPAEGTGLDGNPCRGVAGQIMFFSTNQDGPALVNGTVEILVFDDQGAVAEQSQPLETFSFTSEQWDLFVRPTKSVGAAYQLFVPYTRPGAHQAVCTLRVKYTPPEATGIPIYSKMASVLLVGSKPDGPSRANGADGPAAYENKLSTGIKHRPDMSELGEYRRIAQASGATFESTTDVVQAAAQRESGGPGNDRERLKQRMSEILNGPSLEPERVSWEPQQQTIRPQPIHPTPVPDAHPLQ